MAPGGRIIFQEVFDCAGRDFPQEWGALYTSLSRPEARRAARRSARAAVDRWRNRTSAAWRTLLPVLLGEASQRDLRGFCVHGYCAAARVAWNGGTAHGRAYWQDVVNCSTWGGEWPTYRFLGESRWGTLLGEAPVPAAARFWRWPPPRAALPARAPTDGHGLAFLRPPAATDGRDEAPLPAAAEDRYLHDYRVQLFAALAQILPLRPEVVLPKVKAGLNFAAFGVHLTTLLEPVAAMRKVLPSSVALTVAFHGSTHPPPQMLIEEVCGLYDSAAGFRCYVSETPGDKFWMDITDRSSITEALSVLSGTIIFNDFIRSADCLICGGGHAPVLCLLLRMVTSTPLFFNLQAPLTFRMPVSQDTRTLLVAYFRELAKPAAAEAARGRTVLSTSLIFFQRQYWVQTGCLLPIVRNHNLYVLEALRNAGFSRLSSPVEKEKEILFWQNHVALKADYCMVLWRFVKQTVTDSYPYKLVFKNMKRMPASRSWRKVYALGEYESTTLTYSSIARRFAAAVVFPHDLGTISFDDLYAMGLTVFMPADELVAAMAAAHLSSTRNYPWYMLREEHAELPKMHSDADGEKRWEPGWGGREAVNATGQATYLGRDLQHDPAALIGAAALSNYALFPHVRRFRSVAGLLLDLARLAPEDFAATAEAMRRSSEETWQVTAEFYRRATAYLLGADLSDARL